MTRQSISVVICTYADEREVDLRAAIDSVRRQTTAPEQLIVVVDHNPGLLDRVREHEPDVLVIPNRQARGLAGARNTGLAAAVAPVIAFLDDDAVAAPGWLAELGCGYDDLRVVGVGGAIEPHWCGERPAWFPDEFGWVVGCGYRGLPDRPTPVRNLIGANMSFRREAITMLGGFRIGLGRLGTRPLGGEETELCIRLRQRQPADQLLYQPRAVVYHRVPASRMAWRYFGARCYAEGLSKASIARLVGDRDGLSTERGYALRVLPRGVGHGLADALRGDPAGLGRAAAIVAGLALTTAGFLSGTLPMMARLRG